MLFCPLGPPIRMRRSLAKSAAACSGEPPRTVMSSRSCGIQRKASFEGYISAVCIGIAKLMLRRRSSAILTEMRNVYAALALSVLSAACFGEQNTRAKEDAAKAQVAIKQALNADVVLQWRMMNGSSGKRFDVYVKFSQTPKGSAAEIRETVERIVHSSFRDNVTSVAISL